MKRFATVLLSALLCCCTATLAQPAIDGSAADVMYGTALATQNNQTGFGDSSLGRPDFANGSELDVAYAVVHDGILYLALTGNLESNGNKLEIFFDTRTGGQNQLLNTNPDVDFNGLNRMGFFDETLPGLKFDTTFAADFYVTFNLQNDGTLYGSLAELYVDELNPGVGYYLGAGLTVCDTNGGALTGGNAPFTVLATLDNSNILGVTGGFGADTGAGVLTGFECAIPLSALGNPVPPFKVCAFVNGQQHDWVSNQVLKGLGGFLVDNPGEPRLVDFSTLFGDQFFNVPAPAAPRGACCIGTACSITTQAGCGGTWLGANVSCDGNPCNTIPAGACCIEGVCSIREQTACTSAGGVWLGADTNCLGCPCDANGACCLSDLNCVLLTETECLDANGDFIGAFTICDVNTCTTSSCCTNEVCSLARRHTCEAGGGTFYENCPGCPEGVCLPEITNPHVAGSFQGWNPISDPMTETAPGTNIWTRTYPGLIAGERHTFKITNGLDWEAPCHENFPGADSWTFVAPDGTITITYDGNEYLDGWSPTINRLGVNYDSGTWTAAGDFQIALGAPNNWNNSEPLAAMLDQGDGTYLLEFSNVPAGDYMWKAVVTGSWDSISWDARSINTANWTFTVSDTSDTVRLWVNPLVGIVKQEVIVSDPCAGYVRGDTNLDTAVNALDINPFVICITNPTRWEAEHPGVIPGVTIYCVADINCDDAINALDINPFVRCITNECPPCP